LEVYLNEEHYAPSTVLADLGTTATRFTPFSKENTKQLLQGIPENGKKRLLKVKDMRHWLL
jgi:hypothetical protein